MIDALVQWFSSLPEFAKFLALMWAFALGVWMIVGVFIRDLES